MLLVLMNIWALVLHRLLQSLLLPQWPTLWYGERRFATESAGRLIATRLVLSSRWMIYICSIHAGRESGQANSTVS
jgi:hypothetical protein